MKPLRKAVFPVAGFGTRFLPATKAIPKEMLTVVDRPVLQYVVDEAKKAGIEHLIFITGRNKAVIEDYFDIQYELYSTLEARGKAAPLEQMKAMQPGAGTTSFTRQQEPLGLGHAVWCARDIVGNEPFALLLPDMILHSKANCMSEMAALYAKTGGNVISLQECAPEDAHKYGIVGRGQDVHNGFELTEMVEKPEPGTAPSNLFINGRYILQPEIFDILETQERGAGNEIQLTDAMLKLKDSQSFYGYHFTGHTFDCGNPEGFVAANMVLAHERDELRLHVESIAKSLAGKKRSRINAPGFEGGWEHLPEKVHKSDATAEASGR